MQWRAGISVRADPNAPARTHARAAMAQFMVEHPRGRHGAVEYDLAQFGLDPAERRNALRFYSDRFDLVLES